MAIEVSVVGFDIANNILQVHGVDRRGSRNVASIPTVACRKFDADPNYRAAFKDLRQSIDAWKRLWQESVTPSLTYERAAFRVAPYLFLMLC